MDNQPGSEKTAYASVADIIRSISVEDIHASGTSLADDGIREMLERQINIASSLEKAVKAGGFTDIRELENKIVNSQIEAGEVNLNSDSGGRARAKLVEIISKRLGYKDELEDPNGRKIHTEWVTVHRSPVGQMDLITRHFPLPDSPRIQTPSGTWQLSRYDQIAPASTRPAHQSSGISLIKIP